MEFALLIRNKILKSSIDYLNPGTFYNHPVMLGVKWLRVCGIDIDGMVKRGSKHSPPLHTFRGLDEEE